MKLLTVSANPHVRDNSSTASIMLDVLIALAPALVTSVVLFGFRALMVEAVCVSAAVLAEYFWELAMKKPITIGDLSAVVTGLLLAFCLPVSIPLWMGALGSVAAIIVVKQLFGGIGCNFANPAATGRIILFLCFSKEMADFTYDSVTSATPLAVLDQGGSLELVDLLFGRHGGCIGEVCALALLIGGAYLLARRVISWHIPVCYLGTVALLSPLAGQNPLEQLLTGGLLLGAIFMATDYVTSPVTPTGRTVYAIGCGALTVFLRYFGIYPEGVSFSILVMNILVWSLDQAFIPHRFGTPWFQKKAKEASK